MACNPMKMFTRKLLKIFLCLKIVFVVFLEASCFAAVNPSFVGWGNTFAPGMGAILREEPLRGLGESALTLGTYYGATYFSKEGSYTIDGNLREPKGNNIWRPLVGELMQEFALKYHMYNTFYHYQQASLAAENEPLLSRYQQPLYKDSWQETLVAPFRWKNLNTFWTYIPIAVSIGYLAYQYRTATVTDHLYHATSAQDAMYGIVQMGSIPIGSSFGEEVFFRGFMQREFHYYFNNLYLGILTQSILFTAAHPSQLRPFAAAGGLYYGYMAHQFNGDLGPAIATHFWIDFVAAFFNFLSYKKAQGKGVPFSVKLSIPY